MCFGKKWANLEFQQTLPAKLPTGSASKLAEDSLIPSKNNVRYLMLPGPLRYPSESRDRTRDENWHSKRKYSTLNEIFNTAHHGWIIGQNDRRLSMGPFPGIPRYCIQWQIEWCIPPICILSVWGSQCVTHNETHVENVASAGFHKK